MRYVEFNGIRPKQKPQHQAGQFAQRAHNLDLMSGRLESFGSPVLADPLVTPTGTLFTGVAKKVHKCGDVFVAWDKFVFVAPDVQGGAAKDQFIYVDDGKLWWQSATNIVQNVPPIVMGLCRPATIPVATVIVGAGCKESAPTLPCVDGTGVGATCQTGDTPESRGYVFTYVKQYPNCEGRFEESAPSAVVVTDILNGDAVSLTIGGVLPAGVTGVNWYRGIAGDTGTAWLLAGYSATGAYIDGKCVGQLGIPLLTEQHYAPPNCLEGVAVVGDAITVVWSGKQFWASHPMMPHAYNVDRYMYDLPYTIVGMRGTSSRTEQAHTYELHILTSGTPFIATATTLDKLDIRQEVGSVGTLAWQPCVSAASICDMGGTTGYASPYGFIAYSGDGTINLTNDYLSEREWGAYLPSTMRIAAWHERVWIASDATDGLVLTIAPDGGTRPKHLVTHDVPVSAWCTSPDISLYCATGSQLFKWGLGAPLKWEWHSGIEVQSGVWHPISAKVVTDVVPIGEDQLEPTNMFKAWSITRPNWDITEFFLLFPQWQHLHTRLAAQAFGHTVMVYGDTRRAHVHRVLDSRPFRLPRSRRCLEWSISVSGYAPVREIHMQTAHMDLAQEGGMA
jgi:hypothetical protein